MNKSSILRAVLAVMLFLGTPLQAVDLPPELPLWEKPPGDYGLGRDVEKQARSYKAPPGSVIPT